MASQPDLSRAALIGLCSGLFLSGAGLFALTLGKQREPVDCSELSEAECSLELSAVQEMYRPQVMVAVCMMVLGLALFVLLRRPPKRDAVADASGGDHGQDVS